MINEGERVFHYWIIKRQQKDPKRAHWRIKLDQHGGNRRNQWDLFETSLKHHLEPRNKWFLKMIQLLSCRKPHGAHQVIVKLKPIATYCNTLQLYLLCMSYVTWSIKLIECCYLSTSSSYQTQRPKTQLCQWPRQSRDRVDPWQRVCAWSEGNGLSTETQSHQLSISWGQGGAWRVETCFVPDISAKASKSVRSVSHFTKPKLDWRGRECHRWTQLLTRWTPAGWHHRPALWPRPSPWAVKPLVPPRTQSSGAFLSTRIRDHQLHDRELRSHCSMLFD